MSGGRDAAAPVRDRVGSPARAAGLLVSLGLLAAACVLSVAVGSALIPPGEVLRAFTAPDGSISQITITEVRVPRTLLGLLVGAALGAAGALMQALTRNPLADPGILGVNAGAALAVSLAVAIFGLVEVRDHLAWAFGGALLGTVLVYAIASRGRGGATPVRLTLVGTALSAVFIGLSQSLTLVDPTVFDRMRFWNVGSVTDRPAGTIGAVLPFVVAGLLLALVSTRALNALALGDEVARSVGVPLRTTRAVGVLAVVLLCGSATAAAGPIAFVGLMVPHAVRWLTGPDQRWVVPYALVLAPALVLLADVVGRLMVWPAEVQVGVVTPLLGAPVLVAMVRRSSRSSW
ncbi:iron chelate uptake ABC transporter family permease subunit [Nocardioides zeae]|uniref:Iron chelate uptake ABC transporter family permease subunit n=1 Tax=Nocardioides imazamoxiresistens TaxID=3231893 RepID=A0ABU3PQN6_9ACTN|nr:iron chelate uptake ABC transporter family permease subunit [Nocardioides zeae]MDT9591527.1 iron chelate uptake ABC transporter family permease subunit [Nocardioides zeae]